MEESIRVLIHRRTSSSGHLTAELSLWEAVAFADAELAQGRAVIVEVGTESQIVRVGKEIVDFVRRLFGRGQKAQPTVTSLTPMAGGETEQPPEGPAPLVPYLARYYRGGNSPPSVMEDSSRRGHRAAPEAEMRAWDALVARIGESAARGLLNGGGYTVRSTLWPSVIYVVTPEIIKVVYFGMQVGRICIVASDGASIWDVVLNRIQLLHAGVDGEAQVFATGELRGG